MASKAAPYDITFLVGNRVNKFPLPRIQHHEHDDREELYCHADTIGHFERRGRKRVRADETRVEKVKN